MRTKIIALAAIVASGNVAGAENEENKWEFSLTPYLWLPTISGDLNYEPPPGDGGDGGPNVEVGPTDWLDLLNGAALLGGSARKGRFSLHSDFVYLSLKSDKDKVVSVRDAGKIPVDPNLNLTTQTKFEGLTWTLTAGYSLNTGERSSVDIIAGVRYFGIDVISSWNLSSDISAPGAGVILPAQGSREKEVSLTDGIVGVQGRFSLGTGRWSAPYYLDVGTGSSDLTWQAMAGVAYNYDWGDLILIYRHLDYDEGSDQFLRNLTLSGPTFGARFRF